MEADKEGGCNPGSACLNPSDMDWKSSGSLGQGMWLWEIVGSWRACCEWAGSAGGRHSGQTGQFGNHIFYKVATTVT